MPFYRVNTKIRISTAAFHDTRPLPPLVFALRLHNLTSLAHGKRPRARHSTGEQHIPRFSWAVLRGSYSTNRVEGPDLRPAAHCLTPDTRPQGPRETPGPRPRGCGGALRRQPPVSFKSRRKFWESCFAACSLNNLMISRIVGNGGRRKVLSVPEVAMKPRGTSQVSPRTFRAAIKSFRAWKGGRERGSIKARLRAHLIGRMYSPEARDRQEI